MTAHKKFDVGLLFICLGLALALRLPGLTVFLTADEARSWFGRSIIFLDSLAQGNWANTAPGGEVPYLENVSLSPAPGVTTMWAGAMGLVIEYLRQGAPDSLSQFLQQVPFDPLDPAILVYLRLPGVLIAVAAVGLTFWWSRPLLGHWGAFLASGLFALDPFSLALSRVLGHDGLVSIFMWLSLLAFIRAITNDKKQNGDNHDHPLAIFHPPSSTLLLSGAFTGLACLSKYPALFMGGFVALSMFLIYLGQDPSPQIQTKLRNTLPVWLKDMIWWSVAAGVVFILLWPAMWVNPFGPVTTILNDALRASGGSHPKGSFFLGQPVPDPGWLFYPLVALFRTTPIILLGLLLALWQAVSWRVKPTNQQNINVATSAQSSDTSRFTPRVSLILLAYILFYALLVTYGGKKQDRYLLPIFPAFSMLATIGYLYFLHNTQYAIRNSAKPPLGTHYASLFRRFAPALILTIQAVFILPAYPYYFSFYNPLAGGGAAAERLIQVGWGEGLDEAAAYLNTLPNAESLKIVSWYSTTFEPYFKGQTIYKIDEEKISRSPKPGLAADYVVFYVNQTQRQIPSEGALQYFMSASPVYTVTLNSINYAWIYPSAAMQHVFGGEVRLVGQSELLGYNLINEAGQPVTSTYPESVVFLSLYWEWQGQAAEDKLRVSLIDDAGQTRGYGNPIETVAPVPREAWQDGMIARDDFALVIFPDTPPGEYHLSAWIERPASGETVGVFPLAADVTIPIVPRAQADASAP